MTIPGITAKQELSEVALRALALAKIHQKYPASKWTHAYNDGSTENSMKNDGSRAYIK